MILYILCAMLILYLITKNIKNYNLDQKIENELISEFRDI